MNLQRAITLASVLLVSLTAPGQAQLKSETGSFATPSKSKVLYERFGDHTASSTLIVLHGSSGPAMDLYQQQARYFAGQNFNVILPHYFDAGRSTIPSDQNYALWEQAIESLIATLRQSGGATKIFLLGYSLGASVALAVGSQDQSVTAVAEWYGSLPDTFFFRLQGMPPLLILHGERDTNIPVSNARQLIRLCELKHLTCDNHLYPGQAHGFDDATLRNADERTLTFFARFANASEVQPAPTASP